MDIRDIKASVSLPPELHLAATIKAKQLRMSLSAYIARLVQRDQPRGPIKVTDSVGTRVYE